MPMTKKDYETVAASIAKARYGLKDYKHQAAIDEVVEELADAFSDANPKFDRGRFMNACDRRGVS